MIKTAIRSAVRPSIGFVHALVLAVGVLVLFTGRLTLLSAVVWLALCVAVDQGLVWPLWSAGDRSGPGPNRGWF